MVQQRPEKNGPTPKPDRSNAEPTRDERPSRKSKPFLKRHPWLVIPFPFLAALCLSGCVTTGTTATTTKAICEPWRSISYSGRGDTAKTVREIRVHNRVGQKLRCWK